MRCVRRGTPAARSSAHRPLRDEGPYAASQFLKRVIGSVFWRDAQAGVPSAEWPRAQLAFKDSMVRGILQFTPGIAFRYVLHRCESRDIRCRESCGLYSFATQGTTSKLAMAPMFGTVFLDAFGAVGSFTPSPQPEEGRWFEDLAERRTVPSPTDWMTRARSVLVRVTTMILPQVHLRKPCYDFSFL